MRRKVSRVFVGGGDGETLVVLIHGCTWVTWKRRAQLRHVFEAVRDLLPAADVCLPVLPIEFWSLQDPDRIVGDVLDFIDSVWEKRRSQGGAGYQRVLLIGFSFGSVLARQLFCRAAGALPDGTVDERAARPWANRVTRIVLLAGLNRGWTVDSPVTRIESALNNIGTAIGHVLPKKPTLFSIRRGAPFLTLTRLQWLALRRAARTPALTVQLLGTRDDVVSPADNIDLATGADFVYLEVPHSGHFEVIDMSLRTPEGAARRRIFALALAGSREELDKEAIAGIDLITMLPAGIEGAGDFGRRDQGARPLRDVVFVVHGIRDKGYWTRKIARVVLETARDQAREVAALTPSYGYFAMLPFLLPWTRRAKVEWLLDLYVSVRSWHPEANVSFIGHSNGTYILAGAIDSCRAVRFEHVVFAGSVVRSDYDWARSVGRGQIGRVLNYVATSDWVVAIFPRMLQVLRLQDLGGAGHDGFDQGQPFVTDVEYLRGRHSAALDEQHWSDIASFVLDGMPMNRATVRERTRWVEGAAYAAPAIWLLLVVLAATPVYLLLTALGLPELTGLDAFETWQKRAVAIVPAWLSALVLMFYVRIIGAVLTHF